MVWPVKYLLLQARNPGDPAGPHECDAFVEEMRLEPGELVPWDLLAGRPTPDVMAEIDCVLVGGSGEYGVNDTAENPWLHEFFAFMGDLADEGFPTFASCFGFQALVVAGGGTVVTDKNRAEVGTFPLYTTEAGAEDPLFAALVPEFKAQFGHKDHVTVLPSTMVHLARSERSPYQALKVDGKPIYATQFHPELSMEAYRERAVNYADAYTKAGFADSFEDIMAGFRDSESASGLLRHFVRDHLHLYGKETDGPPA